MHCTFTDLNAVLIGYSTPGIHTPSDIRIGNPLRRSRAYTVNADTTSPIAIAYIVMMRIGRADDHRVDHVRPVPVTMSRTGRMSDDTSASNPDVATCAIGNTSRGAYTLLSSGLPTNDRPAVDTAPE